MIEALRPRRFPDEEQNASVDLIHWVCWSLMVVATPVYLGAAIAFPATATRAISLLTGLLSLLAVVLILNYRGWTRLSGIALPLLLWALITIATTSSGGIHSPNQMFFPFVVLLAGFAGGSRNGILVGILCSLTTLVFALDLIPSRPIAYSNGNLWLVSLLGTATAIGVQYLAVNTLRNALRRASNELAERKRAEEALVESERNYREIVRELGDGVGTVDAEGRSLVANPAMERIFGLEPGGLAGRRVLDFMPPEDRPILESETLKRRQGETSRYQIEIVRPDGIRRKIHVTATPRFDAAGAFFGAVTIIRDVTDPRTLEGQIRLLAHALGSTGDCIWIADPDGQLLYINDALRRTFDYEEGGELLGRSISALAAGGLLSHDLSNSLIDGWRGEVLCRSRTGRAFPMELTTSRVRDEHGAGIAWVGVGRDVTQEKQAEATLKESERRFRAHMETVQLAAMMIDRSGAITFCNDFFLNLTGWSREELVGHPAMNIIAPEDKSRAGFAFQVLREQATLPLKAENLIATKSGRKRLMEWNNTPLLDPEGKLAGFCGLGVDITEHRALVEQRQQSERLESVGRLAAGVAHDFNNLLTVINGYSELALRQVEAGTPLGKSLQEIRKAGEQAAALTRQLLTFSRQQLIVPGPIPLNQVIRESERMFEQLLVGRVRLTMSLGPEVGHILGDKAQLQQVLMNLMTNALHAMPDGGVIRIETLLSPHPEARPGEWALLAVTDNGVGMDRETLAHIFEPFFTTRGDEQGTGLGLSIVYGVVRQNNGYLTVESEPGLGTTFRIWWPMAKEHPEIDAGTAALRTSGGSETILVVEDRDEVRELVKAILGRSGYHVLTASGANTAIQYFDEFPESVDLLLTDILMPGMNGRDLATLLTKREPRLKVIFMSGYEAGVLLKGSLADSGIAFLQKPLAADDLINKVREVLDSRSVRT
jgi:two-component system cell cycle sensor histidine kinase/response regulator CckA